MGGLRRLCKLYGRMTIQGEEWVWDYVKDEPVKKSEMTHVRWCESERVKHEILKKKLELGEQGETVQTEQP